MGYADSANNNSGESSGKNIIRDCATEVCTVGGVRYTSNTSIPGNDPVPLKDGYGKPVLDSSGNPMVGPSRANLDTVANEFKADLSKGKEFRQGGEWDFQRVKDDSGRYIFTESYRDFANVAIGYAFSGRQMGWVEASVTADVYALFKSKFNEPMHPILFSLPKALVYDYQQGDRVYQSVHPTPTPGVLQRSDYNGM